MRVSDVMTKQVQTIGPDAPIVEAACVMRDCDIGVLPVCDGDQITGMVTDRDITIRGVADGNGGATVRQVMSDQVICVREDDDLAEAAQVMRDRQIKRVPVLDSSGKLCGILSLGDLAQTDSDLAEVANEGITEGAGMDDGEPGRTSGPRPSQSGSRPQEKQKPRGGLAQSGDSSRARAQARGSQDRSGGSPGRGRPGRGGGRNR